MTCVLLCASLWVAIQTSYRERFRLSRISEFLCPDTGGTSARPTVRAGRRTLCVGQECRKTSQRDRYAPQASGPPIQKAAGHAPKPPFPRPVADALGCREIGSGPRLPVRAPASARGRPGGNAGDIPVWGGQEKTPSGGMARRTLLAALQPDCRRSQCPVGALRAVDADRIGLPIAQE